LRRAELALIRDLLAKGAEAVAWHHPSILQDRFPSPNVAEALRDNAIGCRTSTAVLGEAISNDIEDVVIAWMKKLGTKDLGAGGSFRESFCYRHLSLWWWAELFIYHDTPLRLYVRDVETLYRLVEQEKPDRLVLVNPVRDLARVAEEMGLPVEVHGEPEKQPSTRSRTTRHSLSMLLKMWGTGIKSLLRFGREKRPSERPRFLFLTHASMWRERVREDGSRELFEMYFEPILRAVREERESYECVAVGPSVPYQRRTWSVALKEFLELEPRLLPFVPIRNYFTASLVGPLTRAHWTSWLDWRRFWKLPGIKEGFEYRGIRVDPHVLEAFRTTFLLQLPWAIRTIHEIQNLLKRERPSILLLYAESTGLGRAIIAAARKMDVPTFAVQHGLMYPRYYAFEHTSDEVGTPADGGRYCPLPTRTAVFGSLARDLMIERGNYPPESLVITGSPKFDALLKAASTYDRATIRKRHGVPDTVTLLVGASRWTAIGTVFRDVVKAVESEPSVWLLVKPHQAERPDRYEQVIEEESAKRVRVVSVDENLISLIVASDGLLTVQTVCRRIEFSLRFGNVPKKRRLLFHD
jgi:hypothetical protein